MAKVMLICGRIGAGKTFYAYTKQKAAELAASGVDVILDDGFWPKSQRDEYRAFYRGQGIDCELHYIDTPEERRLQNIEKRNQAILAGKERAHFMDETYIHHYFEEPGRDEADVWVQLDDDGAY